MLLLPGIAPLEILKGYQNAHKVENILGVYLIVFDTQIINQYTKVNRALSHVQKRG